MSKKEDQQNQDNARLYPVVSIEFKPRDALPSATIRDQKKENQRVLCRALGMELKEFQQFDFSQPACIDAICMILGVSVYELAKIMEVGHGYLYTIQKGDRVPVPLQLRLELAIRRTVVPVEKFDLTNVPLVEMVSKRPRKRSGRRKRFKKQLLKH